MVNDLVFSFKKTLIIVIWVYYSVNVSLLF